MLKNAIVVMFDSLQHNYLGCYGNDWIKTPNFDRFAREGVVFENNYIEGLPTVPCRRAMHTGRYTLPKAGWVAITMEDTTIADLCWGRPIDTALIFDCPMYRLVKFGYTRGFDKVWFTHGHEADDSFYSQDPLYHLDPKNYISETAEKGAREQLTEAALDVQYGEISSYLKQMQYWRTDEDRYVARTMKKAVEYLKQVDRNKQFFLWVDSFDPHEPWNPPSVYMDFPCPYDPEYKGKEDFLPFMGACDGMYTEKELKHVRALYAELVTLCDKWFGYLLDNIRALGFEENTLVMQVSDHGEPLGYGEHGHGIMRKCRPWPYEELVHAPMMLRAPGIQAGLRIKAFTQSVDVAPTVCDWLGIGVHPDMQGFSLLPLVRGEVKKVRDFAVAGYYSASEAIYTEEWSYIHWPRNTKEGGPIDDSAVLNMMKNSMGSEFDNIPEEAKEQYLAEGKRYSQGVASNEEKARKDALSGSNEALAKHDAGATIDGEAQWTCTPGAAYITSSSDELYDRIKDPFQLNNVADKHPDVCEKLLKTLTTFLSDMKG